MTELRNYVKRSDTLYLIATGNVAKDMFETVVFAVSGENKDIFREIHRQLYTNKKDAKRSHHEIFNEFREKNNE